MFLRCDFQGDIVLLREGASIIFIYGDNPRNDSLHSHHCSWIILVVHPSPPSLLVPTLSTPENTIFEHLIYERVIGRRDHRVIISSCLLFCHLYHRTFFYQNHQYIQHLYSHPTILFLPSSTFLFFFYFSPSTHTLPNTPKHHSLSLFTHTGTSTTSPTPSAPNSLEATAASNARKTNAARKSPPPKHSLS